MPTINSTGVDPVGRLRTTTYYVSTTNLTRVDPSGGATLPTHVSTINVARVDPYGGASLPTYVSTINVTRVDPYGGASLPTSRGEIRDNI